jgi:hypothetical protein
LDPVAIAVFIILHFQDCGIPVPWYHLDKKGVCVKVGKRYFANHQHFAHIKLYLLTDRFESR